MTKVIGSSSQIISSYKVDIIPVSNIPKFGTVHSSKTTDEIQVTGKVVGIKLMRVIDIPQLYLNQHIRSDSKTPMGLWGYLQSLDVSITRDEVMCVVFFD